MIYLDNAATTFPKPKSVSRRILAALEQLGANPGRGGYDMSIKTAAMVYNTRSLLANFFGAVPEEVIFTQSCTYAINLCLKGCLVPGDHLIISSLEHNAVRRPAESLKEKGITVSVAEVDLRDPYKILANIKEALRPETKLIFMTAASNVLGVRLPIAEIGRLAAERGVFFGVDAAQLAGYDPIDMAAHNIDFLCAPGHKGLYGPMGIGVLIARKPLKPVIEGGTGSGSIALHMPAETPDRLEAGTLNVPGIAGLAAGVEFVRRRGVSVIKDREMSLLQILYAKLSEIPGAVLYTDMPNPKTHVPVLSFNLTGMSGTEVESALTAQGIAVRGGLHCAPMAHRQIGTLNCGTVRVCPSVFNTERDIWALLRGLGVKKLVY